MRETRYTTVSVTILDRLSGLPADAKCLYFSLLLGPHRTSCPGLFRSGPAALAEGCEVSSEDFARLVAVLVERGLVAADFAARVVFLPHAVEDSPPDSGKNVASWRTVLNEIPFCALKVTAWRALRVAASAARDRAEARAAQEGKQLAAERWEALLGPEPGTADAPSDAPSDAASTEGASQDGANTPKPKQKKNPTPRGSEDFSSLPGKERIAELVKLGKREAREKELREAEILAVLAKHGRPS